MKITKQAMTALQGSIEHWERVVEGEKTGEIKRIGHAYCPLCFDFNNNHKDRCDGCPIAQDTGQPHCRLTPYDDAADYHGACNEVSVYYCRRELNYLRGLKDRCEVCDEADIS